MNVVVEIGHPAHVHMFRHTIHLLQSRGHSVCVCAWDKDLTLTLLDAFGIEHRVIGQARLCSHRHVLTLGLDAVRRLRRETDEFRPDVFLSRISPVSGVVSRLRRRPHIAFGDTDVTHLSNLLGVRLSDLIITPRCFHGDLGKKQMRVNSYKELAYLHPNCFVPDDSVLAVEGLSARERFALVRFIGWGALHDRGQSGFSTAGRLRLVKELSQRGRVVISSETELPSEYERYLFRGPVHLIHHFLRFASVCVTEGGTMATESAVLGTPAICFNSLRTSVQAELQKRYGLVVNYHHTSDEDTAIREAARIMCDDTNQREHWRALAAQVIRDSVDLTPVLVHAVEAAPASCPQ
ncbi:MAG: DUF354 domain-containing protein [Dehalococcoidia bacterium]|nr:DUF354 domain-containing protein [Dehalococcoidia bacterium]